MYILGTAKNEVLLAWSRPSLIGVKMNSPVYSVQQRIPVTFNPYRSTFERMADENMTGHGPVIS